MVETLLLGANITLPHEILSRVLSNLAERGWTPAIWESQRAFIRMTQVHDKGPAASADLENLGTRISASISAGDVFIRDGEVYFLVTTPNELKAAASNAAERYILMRTVTRNLGEADLKTQVGVISNNTDGLDGRLVAFGRDVELAIKVALGREDSADTFWTEVRTGTPRLDAIVESQEKEAGPSFQRAKLDCPEVNAARVLASRYARETLIELSQAVFVRERDLLSRKKAQAEIKISLDDLKAANLLRSEYLLECRRTNAPLTRFGDASRLESSEMAMLACPACNSPFTKELLSEGFSLSDLGRTMARQSYWMTVWVTDLLVRLGVPTHSMLWNISEAGEEVDLLVEYLNQLWIFELKDREFGAGDAHPFNYRQVRYKANKSVIITTERVSRDAKRVFSELNRESRRHQQNNPVYVEGLDCAESVLKRELSEAALRYARQRFEGLTQMSGFDLSEVLKLHFGDEPNTGVDNDVTYTDVAYSDAIDA